MKKDDFCEWIPVFSYDIEQQLEGFENDFHEYFSRLSFEKRTSKIGRKMFKAYQQIQDAFILVSKATSKFVEIEDYFMGIDDE